MFAARFLNRVSSPRLPLRLSTQIIDYTFCHNLTAILEQDDGTSTPSASVEEERLPFYNPDDYYPMRIGDVLKDRYQVIAKLGFGVTSTVWLCRDLKEHSYRVIKAHICTLQHNQELEVFKYLSSISTEHGGRVHVRQLEDSFKMKSRKGEHDFFIMTPLGLSIRSLQDIQKDSIFPQSVVKGAVDQVLFGLNFLHESDVIHTDLHSDNLLIAIRSDEILSSVEEAEIRTPSARKQVGDRITYVSRYMLGDPGQLIICDFGQARIGNKQYGNAMPVPYRAPEVILGMDWDSAVDLWSVALLAWSFLQPERLFTIYDTESEELNDAHHLAAITALLGPPPLDFLKRGKETNKSWDIEGKWKGPVPLPSERNLHSLVTNLAGDDKDDFLDLLSGLLRWLPEKRLTAGQSYYHCWLRGSSDEPIVMPTVQS